MAGISVSVPPLEADSRGAEGQSSCVSSAPVEGCGLRIPLGSMLRKQAAPSDVFGLEVLLEFTTNYSFYYVYVYIYI